MSHSLNLLKICLRRKIVDIPQVRFDKALEEFYAVCDQIEYHLVSNYTIYVL